MKYMTLMQIEVTGIQEYVFGSNNLRQNIGASELVERTTSKWLYELLGQLRFKHNAEWDNSSGLLRLSPKSIVRNGLDAEVIYAGGGNALVLFEGEDAQGGKARNFARKISRKVLEEARGLKLIFQFVRLDWTNESLSKKHRDLRIETSARKLSYTPDLPMVGLSVTAACDFTGLPAVGRDDENRLISQTAKHKWMYNKEADLRLHKILPQVEKNKFEFVYDFNRLGEKGESSYIAVVHCDGNKMGERFQAIAHEYPLPQDNEKYLKQVRHLSLQVQKKAREALVSTVDLLMGSRSRSTDKDEERFGGVVPVTKSEKDGKYRLPFRPIVFGGDDVTFVCDGRLGLALAACYLRELAAGDLPGPREGEPGAPFFASAGVAVVKSHYPFSRAYDLAESLCLSAKERIHDLTPHDKGAVLDWHFSTSGVILPLQQVRAREYMSVTGDSLLMRPVRIDIETSPEGSKYWRSWEGFSSIVRKFLEDDKWAGRRNKIIALRDALRLGPQGVNLFLSNYEGIRLPEIRGQSGTMMTSGWAGEDCGYFDAIEALDFFVVLNREVNKDNEHESGI